MKSIEEAFKYTLCDDLELSLIPKAPGVYIFLDGDMRPLYVGKAKGLRNRISSYLRPGATHTPKTEVMLKRARFLDVLVTGSEKEALILEAQLIGDLKPRYNIRLRDDKAYPFLRIGITSPYPGISIVRKRRKDGAIYFGPYTSSSELRKTLNLLSSLFRLRTCSDSYMKNRQRPCLKFQVGKCSGPCTSMITKERYEKDVNRVKEFLRGKTNRILATLRSDMEDAARALEFERAAMLRDSISAIERVVEGQSVVASQGLQCDVIYMQQSEQIAQAVVFIVREGALRNKRSFTLEMGLEEEISQTYLSFMKLFYSYSQNYVPKEIVIPPFLNKEDMVSITNYLSHVRGSKVRLTMARSGVKKSLLDNAMRNARQDLDVEIRRRKSWQELGHEIRKVLGLKRLPVYVEGIDISNTCGVDSIGSIVSFKDGLAQKARYRYYNIRQPGPDDYAMIREIMSRRIKSGVRKGDLPDLFLIDGGRGQLSAALEILKGHGLLNTVDIVSLAKDRDDEGEKIYLAEKDAPIILGQNSMVLRFCQKVRDEAHRFGLDRHRKKRMKRSMYSRILDIPGVGPKRQKLLLKYFGSIKGVSAATVQELMAVPGISERVARNIHQFLKQRRGLG